MNFMQKLWEFLNDTLGKADITGSLDGKEFRDVSFSGSGHRAFVVKGWVDPDDGPAVRFRADWENLDDGEVFLQKHPSDKGWQETKESGFRIEREDSEVSIVMDFQTIDDVKHTVRFTADINLSSIFEIISFDF